MRFRPIPLIRRDALFATVFTFVVTGLLYFLFVNISFLDPFEAAFKDFRFTDMFYAKGMYSKEKNTNIILVNVGHANRFEIAAGIEKINGYQPAAVGLDMIFRDRKSAFMDSVLKARLRPDAPIVYSYYRENDSIVQNHPYFETNPEDAGYINLDLRNEDSRVIRNFRGSRPHGATQEVSFATRLAIEAGWITQTYAQNSLNKPLPIQWIGNQDSFLSFSLDEVRASEDIPAVKDAIVLFGYLGPPTGEVFDIEDKHFTPLNPKFVGRSTPDMYGMVIHANILNLLNKKTKLREVSKFWTYVLAFIITYLVILQGMRIYRSSNLAYDLAVKGIQVLIPVVLVYVGLLLMKIHIYLPTLPLVLLAVFGIELIDYYVYLMAFLNKKFGWRSSLLES